MSGNKRNRCKREVSSLLLSRDKYLDEQITQLRNENFIVLEYIVLE